MMNSKATTSVKQTGGRRRGARHASAGFTFVELIIIMGIILTIAAIAVPALKDAIKTAKTARAVADVRTIGDTALGYSAEYGYPPNSLADIWYDKQLDPWGHPYQYLPITDSTDPATQRQDRFDVTINKYFDLYSMGLDGETSIKISDAQGLDDIIWANDGVYMGVAAYY
jgi:general secretion pathway protein G